VRAGKELAIELRFRTTRPAPAYLNGAYPSYFIYGPVVFSNATDDFVSMLARAEAALSNLGSPLSPGGDQRRSQGNNW